MPLLLGRVPGNIVGLVAAEPGRRVEASAAAGVDTSGVPAPSRVVGWVLVADEAVAGGARVDPVFLADGRMWTPDQFWDAYGTDIELKVV